MTTPVQKKRRLKAVILNFLLSGASFAAMIVGLAAGYLPSSRGQRYGNITASARPVNFWVTIAFLFFIGVLFLFIALWSLRRYKSDSAGHDHERRQF
ncbi:MAG: hypothetical protein K1X36_13595 [Pyrinomonadaceae bacterium]|nr:hypothetical protein [Pyrinomonadaceae bacterium]